MAEGRTLEQHHHPTEEESVKQKRQDCPTPKGRDLRLSKDDRILSVTTRSVSSQMLGLASF